MDKYSIFVFAQCEVYSPQIATNYNNSTKITTPINIGYQLFMVIKRVHKLIVAWSNRWRLRAEIVRPFAPVMRPIPQFLQAFDNAIIYIYIYILLHFKHMSRSIKPYFTPAISEKSLFGKVLLLE